MILHGGLLSQSSTPGGKRDYCALGVGDAGSMSGEEKGDGLWDGNRDEAS